jgi:peptidoglycan-associated lipoprotein
MKIEGTSLKKSGAPAVLALLTFTTACAHVGQQEFDDRLASLRADLTDQMEAGDEAVVQRLADTEARLAALESDVAALEEEFGATVERLETALRFHIPVHFGFDDDGLNPGARDILARFGEVAREYYPGSLITVEGFTDPAGTSDYNLQLGQRRAESVKAHLVNVEGFNADQVRAVSYGEDSRRLVTAGFGPGDTGWQNRRVVLVIDHDGTAPAGGAVSGGGAS